MTHSSYNSLVWPENWIHVLPTWGAVGGQTKAGWHHTGHGMLFLLEHISLKIHALPSLVGWPEISLRWWRESSPLPCVEQHRPVRVWHMLMHKRAIAISGDMCFKALQNLTPRDTTNLLASFGPRGKTIQARPQTLGILMADHVNEGIAHGIMCLEIDWEVEEVESSREAFLSKQRLEVVPCVLVGQIADHQCCPLLLLKPCHPLATTTRCPMAD